jgi:protein O-GlcNAc transferase
MNAEKIKNLDLIIIKRLTGPSGPQEAPCGSGSPTGAHRAVLPRSGALQDTKDLVALTFSQIANSDPDYKITELIKLIYFDPTNYLIYTNIGSIYLAQGKLSEARSFFHVALIHNPNCVEALLELGILYRSVDNDASILLLEKANLLVPNDMRVLNTLAVLYTEVNRFEDAEKIFLKVLTGTTDADLKYKVLCNLGTLLSSMGKNEESLRYLEMSEKMNVTVSQLQTKLLILNGVYEHEYAALRGLASPEGPHSGFRAPEGPTGPTDPDVGGLYFKEHLKINNLFKRTCIYSFKDRPRNGKIKIGYVSSDFRNHVVAKFIMNLMLYYDKNIFDVYCYYNFKSDDQYTELFKQSSIFKNICNHTDTAAADMIYADGIDILIDLNGNTAGARFDIFALKPAPIQVTYLGYPGTSGLLQMDYRITDYVADHPKSTQKYTEKLVYLDEPGLQRGPVGPVIHGCFLTYSWIKNDWQTNSPEFIKEYPNGIKAYTQTKDPTSGLIFGSINRAPKNSPQYLAMIKELMSTIPDSKILIKVNTLCDQEYTVGKLLDTLGINRDRLIIVNYQLDPKEYYNIFNKIDVLLDTWPYSGTTTTCDCLFMGTPVVTLYNKDIHAHCVSASILNRIAPELVSHSVSEYIDVCNGLSKNRERLVWYKRNLRARLEQTMDPHVFMKGPMGPQGLASPAGPLVGPDPLRGPSGPSAGPIGYENLLIKIYNGL